MRSLSPTRFLSPVLLSLLLFSSCAPTVADDATEKKSPYVSDIFAAPVILKSKDKPLKAGSDYSSPALFDIDNDGQVELVIGGIAGDLTFCENTSKTGQPAWTSPKPLKDADGKVIRLNNW